MSPRSPHLGDGQPGVKRRYVQNLQAYGIDTEQNLSSGKFALKTWKDTYLNGRGVRGGHKKVWATGDMNWAGKNPEDSWELVKYESQLKDLKLQIRRTANRSPQAARQDFDTAAGIVGSIVKPATALRFSLHRSLDCMRN